MASYTDADAIAAYLGVTFTPEQEAQAEAVADAVTAYIDGYTGRTWQGTSPVTGELANVLPGSVVWPGAYGIVYLLSRPVTSVTGVTLRTAYPHATETVLAATEYELVDGPNGVLTLVGGYGGPYPGLLALIDYAYTAGPPADIELAATMIASGQMSAMLAIQRGSQVIAENPSLAGLESIAVGQNDVSVKLGSAVTGGAAAKTSAAGSSWAAPGSAVAAILDRYRRPVIA